MLYHTIEIVDVTVIRIIFGMLRNLLIWNSEKYALPLKLNILYDMEVIKLSIKFIIIIYYQQSLYYLTVCTIFPRNKLSNTEIYTFPTKDKFLLE